MGTRSDEASTPGIVLATAALWSIWGSTYLAIRFAVEALPPLLMSGIRFLVAGSLLFAVQRLRGQPAPTRLHWRNAAIVGALLLLCGNGAVAWVEQWVPSGLVALTVAMVPAWMTLFDWLAGGPRPTPPLLVGLLLGFVGVGVLMGPDDLLGHASIDPRSAAVVVGGSIAWAWGSIYSRAARRPRSPLMSTAMQMLCGGASLTLAGLAVGEAGRLDPGRIDTGSLIAWGYLVVFGSLIAFSAYVYLLHATEPAKASTYAYVNPVIAVILGWALAGEPLNARIGLALAAIVPGVALIVTFRPVARVARRIPEEPV